MRTLRRLSIVVAVAAMLSGCSEAAEPPPGPTEVGVGALPQRMPASLDGDG